MTPLVMTAEDDPGFVRLPDEIKARHRWAQSLKPAMPTVENARGCEAAIGPATLGDVPLAVVSTGNETPNYAELQKKLLGLSSNSRQFMALESFHAIEMSEPQLAARAILHVVEAARLRIND